MIELRPAERRMLLAAGKLGGVVAVWRSEAFAEKSSLPSESISGATCLWICTAHASSRWHGPRTTTFRSLKLAL